MAAYRLTADEHGHTRLEPMDLFNWPFENGPGEFKGVGGVVGGVDQVIPVDLRIPGCPPSPTQLLSGLLALLQSVERPLP